MIKKNQILIIFIVLVNFGCQKSEKLSKTDKYFTEKLNKEKLSKSFEEDSEFGYIKIGNFFKPNIKNAVVISFDTISNFTIYELMDNTWMKIYNQKNANFSRINGIEAYIQDYNFDGVNDIGIKNEVTNGTGIMTFHLWLTEKKSFKYVPEFEEIGNPIILNKFKIIQGFKACCCFSEITLSDYYWKKNNLITIQELEIKNYTTGIEANLKNIEKNTENKVELSQNYISNIINKYSIENWQLNDTSGKKGLLQ